MAELIRGKTIPLSGIGKTAAPSSDMDSLLQLLDKADKLLNNPLVQHFLGLKAQARVTQTDYQPAPSLPELAIVARSPVHHRIYTIMNRFDEGQLLELFKQYGGQIDEKVLKELTG
jgi:hypothetical protein